jgi:PAS domain S-box-containing protein
MTNSQNKKSTRGETLEKMALMDTKKEERFDKIVNLAKKIFSVNISAISLIDDTREWFKSSVGLSIPQVDIQNSISEFLLSYSDTFVIDDLSKDERFSKKSLVSGEAMSLIFYVGKSLSDLEGNKIGAFFVADDRQRVFTAEEIETFELLAGWAEHEVNRLEYNKAGRLKELRGVQAELARKVRQLAEEKARHDAMLENIGDGVIGINDKGEITFVNSQVKTLLGYAPDELLGKLVFHAIGMVDEEGVEVPMNDRPMRTALYARKKSVSSDYFFLGKGGNKVPVSITSTPVEIYDQVIGGITLFRDITKEKEVDRMKTEFISLASHQLRTPLSAMKWFAEMLLDGDMGPLSDEQMEMINNIYQSNERMIELVNALLNISRIESGRIIIDPKPTDIEKLVREVVLEITPKLEKKRQKLVVSVHRKLPMITVDPKLVRHVYMNLLTNSVKYTPEGGEVVIMISRKEDVIVSQISDNGYGIPHVQQDRVFKKFFRAENIVKKETDGTGLGLYLTKAIIDSSGGRVWFHSEEGKGTTFWFTLPLSGTLPRQGEISIDS